MTDRLVIGSVFLNDWPGNFGARGYAKISSCLLIDSIPKQLSHSMRVAFSILGLSKLNRMLSFLHTEVLSMPKNIDDSHQIVTKGLHRETRRDSLKKKERFRVPIGDALKGLERQSEDLVAATNISADDLAVTINAKD